MNMCPIGRFASAVSALASAATGEGNHAGSDCDAADRPCGVRRGRYDHADLALRTCVCAGGGRRPDLGVRVPAVSPVTRFHSNGPPYQPKRRSYRPAMRPYGRNDEAPWEARGVPEAHTADHRHRSHSVRSGLACKHGRVGDRFDWSGSVRAGRCGCGDDAAAGFPALRTALNVRSEPLGGCVVSRQPGCPVSLRFHASGLQVLRHSGKSQVPAMGHVEEEHG